MLHVDWSGTIGAIRFGKGQCILQASDSALLLRVESTTENALHRLQDGIAHRLETFGHREQLAVQWRPSISTPTGQTKEIPSRVPAPGGPTTVPSRSRLVRNLALAAVATIAIAAHLGLLGATLAIATWTKWGATAILAFIVLKFIVTAGVHVAGGAFAFRHGKAFLCNRRQRHTPSEHEMPGIAPENSHSKAPGLVLRHAELYDFTVWLMTLGRERAFREKILRLARLRPDESVLDVGCGTGSLAIAARRHVGPKGVVKGIDASPEMLARAERKARRAGAVVAFTQAAAQALPFADAEFDVVFSTVCFITCHAMHAKGA